MSDAQKIVILRGRRARIIRRGNAVETAVIMEGRFFAISEGCLLVRLGLRSVTLRLGIAVIVDEAHARCERALIDRGSGCQVIAEAPGESENANKKNQSA